MRNKRISIFTVSCNIFFCIRSLVKHGMYDNRDNRTTKKTNKKKGIQLFSFEAFLELFKEGVEELDLEKALAKALQHCFKASWLSL